MLYLFDLDGTLITPYMDRPDKDYHNWQVLPCRDARLSALRAAGHSVGVVTNQAGVAFGYVSERDWLRKCEQVNRAFSLKPGEMAYCLAHPKATEQRWRDPRDCIRRKPSPKMIEELMTHFHATRDDTLFVGDMESDRQAASAAGVEYMDAQEFFSRSPE
jgi:D-glycero-D-manno-heptose 1,7-bisphosphate phosphatase